MALNLIRKNNSDAVESYHDAAMTFAIFGDGILSGVFNSMSVTLSTNTITINSGMALLNGRLIEVQSNTTEDIDVSQLASVSTCYVCLSLTIADDDSNSSALIYVSADEPDSQTSFLKGSGTRIMALYSVALTTSSGNVLPTAYSRIASLLEPGIAKNAKNLLSGGTINTVAFENIFLTDMSGVRYAKNAAVAAEARGFIGGNKNRVEANLYMPGRGVYLLQEAVLVSSASSTTIAAGGSTAISFDDQSSLSSLEGVVDFKMNGYRGVNAPATIQYNIANSASETFEMNTSAWDLSILVDVNSSTKKVTITNNASTAVTFSYLDIRVRLYGGTPS